MTTPTYTPEQLAALDTARALAHAGIPVFVAAPDPVATTGFALPRNWQNVAADPAVVDQWRPGMAIAAVMGHGLDVVDVDPRNGGDAGRLNGCTPISYGAALTPSGGVHSFVKSLGVRKKTNLLPGIDLQAGAPDGSGRGFVFLAPTVRASKVTGQPTAYRWAQHPDLDRWRAGYATDVSGLALAEMVRGNDAAGQPGAPTAEEFMRSGPWANIEATLAGGRNNGVARLAAALRGRGGWREDDAIRFMYSEVWPLVDQEQGGHPFTADEFEGTVRAQWKQYPDGAEQREFAAATPPQVGATGMFEPPSLLRYFTEKNSLQAATLASDVIALGPIAQGRDDILWAYRSGVWRPAKDLVRDRLTFLLGERYRPGHTRNVADIVHSLVPGIACDPVPNLINFRNGLLDWRAGRLREHTPDVPSTVQLNVAYDPQASCPNFERFLAEVVAPDVVDTIWELIGYLMFSGNPLHKAVMLTGTGRNGKGTFLHVVEELLGRPNITNLSLHSLVERFGAASLFGKLANIAGDIDPTYIENTAVLKAVTGGDTISAEHKFKDRFDFRPWAVPVFSANKIPGSADTTVGYLSRWLVINFPHDFSGRENRNLGEQLSTADELAGVAARGIRALPGLLERGDFMVTASEQAAREEFVRRVDQVRTWLFDCAELDDATPWQARTELYQAYARWAARDGHRPVKATEFYDRLEAAGARPAKLHGARGFTGVRVTDAGHVYPMGAATLPGRPAQPAETMPPPTSEVPPATVNSALGAQGAQNSTQSETGCAPSSSPMIPGVPEDWGHRGHENPISFPARAPTHTYETKWPGAAPCAPNTDHTLADEPESAKVTRRLLEARAANGDPPSGVRRPVPDGRGDAEARTAAKAATKQAQLETRVAEASGPLVDLPAVVTRDGAVRPISAAGVAELATAFRFDVELTVDVETTGFPVGHADYALRTVQLGTEHVAVVFDAQDPAQLHAAGELLAAAPVLHAHSATADLVPLAVAGAVEETAWGRMHDTVIPAKLADPASTGSDPGLKQLAGAVLGERAVSPGADEARAALFKAGRWLTDTKPTTPVERSGWAQVDPRCTTMIRYAASDVLDDAALARRLPPVPLAVLERERLAQRMTARVAHRGLRIDGGHVAELLDRERAAIADAAERLRAFGVSNPGSDREIAATAANLGAALPTTKTGRLSVAAGALEQYRRLDGPLGDFVRARLGYQKAETALGLFLEPYHQLVTRGDGRARPTIYTLAADTGRMSCLSMDALIEMPRDLAKYPDGVPITEVRAGDWVYAFDHDRELVLKRVKWCAQTGVRQTLIITAENSAGKRITLRATPDHLIRLRNGDYRAAGKLLTTTGARRDGVRLMPMVKRQIDDGYVKFFPHSIARLGAGVRGGGKVREHRWVVEQALGRRISTKADVNHIDGNRANNHPDNLQDLPITEHRGNRDLAWGVDQPELALYDGPTDYRVISVEPGLIEPVWDMEVEDVHNFIANGICVHNCVRPNLQQVPREGGYRACVTADPGELLASADFAGVELRVACALSGDRNLRRLIDEEDAGIGDGVHWAIARLAFGPDATKADRYATKRGVFGRIYGGGITAIARGVGVTETTAAAIIDALDAMLPELSAWSASVRDAVKNGHTQFQTYSGRIVHLPGRFPHKAPNYCIQGTARELLIDTLVRLRASRWGEAILLPVHDELVLAVPEAEAPDATAALVQAMETELLGVPIKAEASQPSFAWRDAS